MIESISISPKLVRVLVDIFLVPVHHIVANQQLLPLAKDWDGVRGLARLKILWEDYTIQGDWMGDGVNSPDPFRWLFLVDDC